MKGESRISSIGALIWHSAGRPSGPSRPPQAPPVHSGVGMAKGNRSPGYLVFGSLASALSSALAISAISAISVINLPRKKATNTRANFYMRLLRQSLGFGVSVSVSNVSDFEPQPKSKPMIDKQAMRQAKAGNGQLAPTGAASYSWGNFYTPGAFQAP